MVVVKPLYGIVEAGAYWWSTYFKHHTEKLRIEILIYDPYLLLIKIITEGFRIISIQTNNTLGLLDNKFTLIEAKELRFNTKEK